MNCCLKWEETLLQYGELDADERAAADRHLARCEGCRIFWEACCAIDRELTEGLAGLEPSSGFHTRVMAHAVAANRPGVAWTAEVLDGIGWLSLLGILAGLIARLAPDWAAVHLAIAWLNPGTLIPIGGVLALGALGYGLHALWDPRA